MRAPNYIIRELREHVGLSQREFAKVCGLSPATILKCERGGEISPNTWAKIKKAYNIKEKPIASGDYVIMF